MHRASATTAGDLQQMTLCAYGALAALREWPGSLILGVGLDAPGTAVSLAANVAGAACLTIEPDAARARTALRAGACDFVVNTLDEALRALKNEIRQRRPLSVGLAGEPAALLEECLERGLAPQLFTASAAYPEAAARFYDLGAELVGFDEPGAGESASTGAAIAGDVVEAQFAAVVLGKLLTETGWGLYTQTFATAAELRAFDARVLELMHPEDPLRRRWLASAVRLFPRDRHRVLWLGEEESKLLAAPEPVS